MTRFRKLSTTLILLSATALAGVAVASAPALAGPPAGIPPGPPAGIPPGPPTGIPPGHAVKLSLQTMGAYSFSGTVLSNAAGQTLHCDHGYAEYFIPVSARKLPIVMCAVQRLARRVTKHGPGKRIAPIVCNERPLAFLTCPGASGLGPGIPPFAANAGVERTTAPARAVADKNTSVVDSFLNRVMENLPTLAPVISIWSSGLSTRRRVSTMVFASNHLRRGRRVIDRGARLARL